MKNLEQATLEMFNWFSGEHGLTKNEALEDEDFLEEFNEVFTEHFDTLLEEELISQSTFEQAEKLSDNKEITFYLKSIL